MSKTLALWQEICAFISVHKNSSLPDEIQLKISNLSKSQLKKFTKITDGNNDTLLHHAVTCGTDDLAKWLIQKEANINAINDKGSTPLSLAEEKNNPAIIQILWQEIYEYIDTYEVSLLPEKFFSQLSMLSKVQLQQFINIKDNENRSLLHEAAIFGIDNLVNFLIQKGANINEQDNNGNTPLILAIFAENPNLVKKLIVNGADLTIKDNFGLTPILVAAKQNTEVINKALKDSNVEFNFDEYNSYSEILRSFSKKISGGINNERINVNLLEGGAPISAMKDLTQRFQDFSKTQSAQDKSEYNAIIKALKTLTKYPSEDLNIHTGKFILIQTGFKGHYIPAVLHKTANGEIQLSIVDRAAFHKQIAGNAYNEDNKSGPCIINIEIPKQHLSKVIELLNKANKLDELEAENIFSHEIPNLVDKKYQIDPQSIQKHLKTGTCY
ncbi:MAG: ankyrin repeat domain-containing protein, partial [Gammaproteobacteria bacterium]